MHKVLVSEVLFFTRITRVPFFLREIGDSQVQSKPDTLTFIFTLSLTTSQRVICPSSTVSETKWLLTSLPNHYKVIFFSSFGKWSWITLEQPYHVTLQKSVEDSPSSWLFLNFPMYVSCITKNIKGLAHQQSDLIFSTAGPNASVKTSYLWTLSISYTSVSFHQKNSVDYTHISYMPTVLPILPW